jgi:uncharacterized protein YrrD
MAESALLANERLKIRPGAHVISDDTEVGRVERVVFRPDTHEIAGLVVGGSIVLGHDVYVPIQAIASAEPDSVQVTLGLTELTRLPPVALDGELRAVADVPGHPGAASSQLRSAQSGQMEALAGGRPLRAGQRVLARDGQVGQLDEVLVDPRTDRASGFVVRKGRFLGRDVIVPADWIETVDQDRIVLKASKAQIDKLPEYRPDHEIDRDVIDALWYGSRLRTADVQFVEVHTRDGVVELTGHTHTEATRKAIEEVVRQVRGVLDGRNHLDTFEALQEAVREAQREALERARTTPVTPA